MSKPTVTKTLRGSTRVTSLDVPPYWSPEIGHGYPLREYLRDLQLWMSCCKPDPARQAGACALNLGGAAALLIQEIDPMILRDGAYTDFNDGIGPTHHTGMEHLVRALKKRFPDNPQEVQIAAISKIFSFRRQRNEGIDNSLGRFDILVHRAESIGGMTIDFVLKAWMLLTTHSLDAQCWADILRDNDGVLPNSEDDFYRLKERVRRDLHLREARSQQFGAGVQQPFFATTPAEENHGSWTFDHDYNGWYFTTLEATGATTTANTTGDWVFGGSAAPSQSWAFHTTDKLYESDSDVSDEDQWWIEEQQEPTDPVDPRSQCARPHRVPLLPVPPSVGAASNCHPQALPAADRSQGQR